MISVYYYILFKASNGDLLHQRSMSMSDVLGEPFSTPVSSKNNMHRSSTMPLNSEDPGDQSPQGSTPSMFGSISSLAGSGVKSLAKSRAAHLGFRGKALLSSALTSLSPASTKNTKEALSRLSSTMSSAATNLSKRYEEMTAASPAPASLETAPDNEDRVSQGSNDSRRPSEAVQVDGIQQDTWSTLTDAFW